MTETAANVPPPSALPVSGPKNCSSRLTAMGILMIIGGVFCALMALMIPAMMALQQAIPAARANVMPLRMMLPNILFYTIAAAFWIWMGIGSIKARRWAPAVILAGSWMWLVCGVVALPLVIILLPKALSAGAGATALPAAAVVVVTIVTGIICLFMYIVIPALLILCYRGPGVKGTCELRNPAPSWTDSCPLPLLAMILMLGGMAITLPGCALGGYPLPFFGRFVGGWAAELAYLLAAGLAALAARGFYRRQVAAWWGTVALLAIFCHSVCSTITKAGLVGYYQDMGLAKEQLATYAKMMSAMEPEMLIFTLAWCIAIIGYLVWLRRYFMPVRESV